MGFPFSGESRIRAIDSLGAHAVRRRRSLRLQIVHGVPLVEARPIALDSLLIVTDPVVRQSTQKIVLLACLTGHFVQRLQG